MENLFHLPQIRISELQQLVLENAKKREFHKKWSSESESVPSIIGSKPSFIKTRSKPTNLPYIYLKCACRTQHHPLSVKHPFLHTKHPNHKNFQKYSLTKTQSCPIEPPFLTDSEKTIRMFEDYADRQLLKTSLQNKIQIIYQQFVKEHQQKIIKRYGLNPQHDEIKKIIYQKLNAMYQNQPKRIFDDDTLLVQQLYKQIQQIQQIKLANKNIYCTEKSTKKLPETKKIIAKQHSINWNHLQNISFDNNQNVDNQSYIEQISKLINKICEDHQQLNTQFFKGLENASLDQLTQKIMKLTQILKQGQNHNKVKKHILTTLLKLVRKVEENFNKPEQKKKIAIMLNQFFMAPAAKVNDIHHGLQMQKDKSRKVITFNKSHKFVNICRNQVNKHSNQCNDNTNDQPPENYQQISLTSIIDVEKQPKKTEIQITQKNVQFSTNKSINKQTLQFNEKINNIISKTKTHYGNVFTGYNKINEYNETIQYNIKEKYNDEQDQHRISSQKQNLPISKKIVRFEKHHNNRKINKNVNILSMPFNEQPKQLQQQKITLTQITPNQPQNKTDFDSSPSINDPIPTEPDVPLSETEQVKKLKQRIKIERRLIKQFMNQNKDIIIAGCNILKKLHLEQLIISQKDGLLTKKMKIRWLRQYIEQNLSQKNIHQHKMINHLLRYLQLYEIQYKLIMHRGKQNSTDLPPTPSPNFPGYFPYLTQSNIQYDQLKFIKLNRNYRYGQSDQKQMNFIGIPYFIIEKINNQNEMENNQIKINISNKNIEAYTIKNFDNLLQKDMPEIGHQEASNKQSQQDEKPSDKLQQPLDSNLYTKIKKTIQQNKKKNMKRLKSNQFLLSKNNRYSCDFSSIRKSKDI